MINSDVYLMSDYKQQQDLKYNVEIHQKHTSKWYMCYIV
jgi:hypothetical protein